MEKDPNNSVSYNSSPINDDNAEKSIVGKFRSIINSTPLSKWFGKQEDSRSIIRRRDEEAEDDEIHQMQPPSKRVKLPVGGDQNNSVIFNTLDSIIPVDVSVTNKTFNHFPEPVAGPSGIKSRKLLSSVTTTISTNSVKNTFSSSELLNGHKDSDSEESTSGYSSVARIGSKEHVSRSQESSKQTSPLQNNPSNTRSLFQSPNTPMNRSLFADRHLSPNANTSMTSRRPSFNASSFGSPNFVDKTITTEKITNSPFYNGRTIYGGASAYGRRLGRSVRDLRTSLKNSVQIKPVNKTNENGNLALGKTARRILETLEQYSSPVNDAKKIPVTSKRFRPDGYISQHVGASPYMVRGNAVPSNKELQVPTVSDLLKMKQKMKLQQSTEVVRQIAISSKSKLNTKTHDQDTCIENRNAEIAGNDASKDPKLGTKEIISQAKSTTPSLPVTKLPKFDVNLSEQSKKKSPKNPATGFPGSTTPPILFSFNPQPAAKTAKTDTNTKTVEQTTNTKSFKFSEPLVISENFKSIIAINNFKFSEPLCKVFQAGSSKSISKEKLAKNDAHLNNKQSSIDLQKTPTNESLQKKPPESVGQNSFGNQFKISSNKWECDVCMVRNKDTDVKCVACTASKPSPKPVVESVKAPPSTFGDKFNMPSTMWECPVCMIRNENDRTKCSACEAPNVKSTSATPSFNFGAKFQAPPNTWECTTCLIKNKDDLAKCAACETPRMGKQPANSLGSVFKIKENEWECTVCMVRNKSSNNKCQCCEAAKPGSSPNNALAKDTSDKKPLPKFNFGIDKAVANSFSFGIPAGQAPALPKPEVDPSTVFGENAKTSAPAAKFSFGIPAESKDEEPKTVEADKPAAERTQLILPAVVPKTTSQKEPVKGTVASAGFKLAEKIPTPISQASVTKKNEESAIKPTATVAGSGFVPAKPIFNFAAAPPNKDKPADKAAPETKEATFTAPPAKLFSFGAKSAVPATTQVPQSTTNAAQAIETSKPATTMPVFAFATNKTTSEAAPPLFGSKTLPTVKNGFDFANTSTFGNTNKPSFDVPPPKNKTEAKPFSFGSTASTGEPASKMPMFSFGPSKTSQAAQSSGFSFGPAKPAGFNFTAGTTETPAFNAPSASIFGAPTTTNNASFTFGSAPQQNTNGQKAGFNFGAPMNSSTSTPAASSGFNFAASAPAPTLPTGGFNFSEAAAGFGSSKPSFNFTDGSVTSFTAPPSADAGTTAPRKIKKAVRRTQR